MRYFITCLLLVSASHLSLAADPQRETTIKMLPELHLLQPIWNSPVSYAESSILLEPKPDEPGVARLALPAKEILSVKSATGEHVYELDRDYKLSDDRRTLLFPKEIAVPRIKLSDLFVPKDSPNSYRHRVGNPEQSLLYAAGRWFHDRQIEVTYKLAEKLKIEGAPQLAEKSLPKTFAKLKAAEPLTLGVSGDSISAGGDASLLAGAPPKMPAFPELVSAQLQASYKSEVSLKNRAVGGWSVANGVGDLEKLLAEKPNLIIVAYGMNDVGRHDPKWFHGQTKTIIERAQAADPNLEIILVAPMLGNNEWVHTPREMFTKYRDELQSLTGPGVALADLTAVWSAMLANKHDLDLIGNGLNHPNDYGHRLYAQAILSLLIAPPADAK